MSNWTVLEQEESLPFGRGFETVLCRKVKYFPVKDKKTGQTEWRQFTHLLLEVRIRYERTEEEVKIRLNTRGGWQRPTFSIVWPEKLEKPRINLGKGRVVIDKLAEEEWQKGEVERYDRFDFEKRLNQMMGEEKASEVLAIFLERFLVELEKARAKEENKQNR